jgi:hypothetical protein
MERGADHHDRIDPDAYRPARLPPHLDLECVLGLEGDRDLQIADLLTEIVRPENLGAVEVIVLLLTGSEDCVFRPPLETLDDEAASIPARRRSN